MVRFTYHWDLVSVILYEFLIDLIRFFHCDITIRSDDLVKDGTVGDRVIFDADVVPVYVDTYCIGSAFYVGIGICHFVFSVLVCIFAYGKMLHNIRRLVGISLSL